MLLATLLLGAAQADAQQKGEWFVKPVLGCTYASAYGDFYSVFTLTLGYHSVCKQKEKSIIC